MKHYVSKYVVCPFYSQEEPLKLHCEGYRKGNRIQLTFSSNELFEQHKKLYCTELNGYYKCPIYPVIMKQYEEKKEDSNG